MQSSKLSMPVSNTGPHQPPVAPAAAEHDVVLLHPIDCRVPVYSPDKHSHPTHEHRHAAATTMPPSCAPSSTSSSLLPGYFTFAVAPVLLALFLGVFSNMTKPSFPVPAPGAAVIITGSSTGIGRHAAAELAAQGFLVFAGVRRLSDVDGLVVSYPGRVVPLLFDVTDTEGGVTRAAEEVERVLQDRGGDIPLAGVVNNAGIGIVLPLELFPLDQFRQIMEVNVMGVLSVTQAFIPRLRRDQGRIINVGSAAGFTVPPGYGAYSSSKFALEAISDAFRIELRPWNISVSLLEPGTIESEIRRKNLGDDLPFKRLSDEAYGLYRQMFDTYEARLMAMERKAGSAQLTTDAIVHALTSVMPQSRYVIGSYQGLSLGAFRRYIMPFLPDHVQDWGKIKALQKAPVAVAKE